MCVGLSLSAWCLYEPSRPATSIHQLLSRPALAAVWPVSTAAAPVTNDRGGKLGQNCCVACRLPLASAHLARFALEVARVDLTHFACVRRLRIMQSFTRLRLAVPGLPDVRSAPSIVKRFRRISTYLYTCWLPLMGSPFRTFQRFPSAPSDFDASTTTHV